MTIDRKYTFRLTKVGHVVILRYGAGCNAVAALMNRVEELEAELCEVRGD